MRVEFFKILSPAFASDLLDGNLYMNTLNYFRRLEDNAAQQDPIEGACGTIRKNQLRQFGFYLDDEMLQIVGDHVLLISEKYGFNNIFCLYQLQIDDDAHRVERPDARLVQRFQNN